jgi:exonuclease SbcC
MIPEQLTLKNFMSYRSATLNLEGVHLACLSGDNGAGKSTILDAITWALWGKARASTDNDLITKGEIETSVDFEFNIGKGYYRVNRRRTSKGAGQTELNVYMRKDSGDWANIGETGVRAKELQIAKLVGTSYETFTNSAFLIQGRADSFTTKTPAERKKVLAEILELRQFELYEADARELSREAELSRRKLDGDIKELDDAIARRPIYERQKELAESELEAGKNSVRRREELQAELKGKLSGLQQSEQDLKRVSSEMTEVRDDLENGKEQIEKTGRSIAIAEGIIARRVEIEEGFARYEEARACEEDFSKRFNQLNQLDRQKNELVNKIDYQGKQLDIKIFKFQEDLKTLQKQIDSRPALKEKLAALQKELEGAEAARMELEGLKTERAAIQGEIKGHEVESKKLAEELPKIEAKARQVPEAGDICPQCGTKLDEQAREHTVQEYRNQWAEARNRQKANAKFIEELRERLKEIEAKIAEAEKKALPYDKLVKEQGGIQKEINTAEEAVLISQNFEKEIEKLNGQKARKEFARVEQEKLVILEQQIATIGYDEQAHNNAREQKQKLAIFESEQKRLSDALTRIVDLREELARYRRNEENDKKKIERLEKESTRLKNELEGLPELKERLKTLEQELYDSRNRQNELQKEIAQADVKIKDCDEKAQQREQKVAEFNKVAEEKGIYAELAEAFGKKGLQAMVIDAALPEIEGEANRLLSGMTDGRMSVRFDTQREGQKGNPIETLELYISDESGPRPYELYSGGEAFRVNFAVRVALSKLLARRSGVQLRTLFIDEGFGSQDGQGRERLVDVIRSIEQDFDRILVITHIQELKDVFPVRIEVVKTPTGSQISVV